MRLTGLGVSAGIGIGKALVLKRGTRDLRFRVPAARVGRELERLAEARERSREQLQQIRQRIATSAGSEHAYLFDAQLLMLDDAMLIERAAEIIRSERLNAGSALERALDKYTERKRHALLGVNLILGCARNSARGNELGINLLLALFTYGRRL